ncbi:hypothetical protein QBC36DRAFT_310999 [Triangularia setosa]|uniref:Uncharacterized protein n=1 Tax=Triangularia setosa TaxID=2587417 RepID=A0AAN7A7Y9_9PEZI|nr:hypothetical protein QBC36DRAFT_310999 [Podospora setosa]
MAFLLLVTLSLSARAVLGKTHRDVWRVGDDCPTEITTRRIPQGSGKFYNMETIYAALLSCPNITTLKMMAVWDNGCVIMDNPYWMSLPFDHLGQDRFRSVLQVLTLDGYESDAMGAPASAPRWYWPEWVYRDLDHTTISGLQSNKTSFDRWIEAMDFSKLHTLNFVSEGGYPYSLTDNVVKVLPPHLTSLRNLSLYFRIGERFILRLRKNSLHHLAWRNSWRKFWHSEPVSSSPLIPVLRHQGASLKSLYFHTDETNEASAPVLTVSEIQQLVELAPNLHSLVIDLRRNNDSGAHEWPWEELKLLVEGLPDLIDLTVYFDLLNDPYCRQGYFEPISRCHELRIANLTDCIEACIANPRVNEATVADIAHFLWRYKMGKSLHRLTIRAGNWGPWFDPKMVGYSWFDGKRAQARCAVVDAVAHVDALGPIRCEAWSTDLLDRHRGDFFGPKGKLGWEDRYLDYFL